MFKNKKLTYIAFSILMLTLAFGLTAFVPIDTAGAAAPDDGISHGRRPGGFRPVGPNDNEALAEELGISLEELQAAQEIVQATVLEDAVADGRLTQEQADMFAERSSFARRSHFGLMEGESDSLLVEALGISVDELQAARERIQAAAIEQALAEGKITEEQAAVIEARQALKKYMDKNEMIAKALGITVDELDTFKEDGQRLPDLMEELGVAVEEFQANMQAHWQEMLEQAVEQGVITQEQADLMLENEVCGIRSSGGYRFPDRGDRFDRPGGFLGRPGK